VLKKNICINKMTTLKYNLDNIELQEIADKLQTLMKTKYKDELAGVPEHIIETLSQNWVIKMQENGSNKMEELEKLLIENNIGNDE